MQRTYIVIFLAIFNFYFNIDLANSKVVGLLQIRNEEFFIEQCLRALSYYTDAIVIVDDASTDNTVNIIKSLENQVNIENLILNKECSWQTKTEAYNKQMLLDAGRKIGGTHFIFIDGDEMFSSYCLKDNWLKKQILSMKPGQVMCFLMVNLWDGTKHWRIDEPFSFNKGWGAKARIFCDDGLANYNQNQFWDKSQTIHFDTIPNNRKTAKGVEREIYCKDLNKAMIHLNAVNLDRIYDKRIMYMCLELIRLNEKTGIEKNKENVTRINRFYTKREFVNMMPKDSNQIKLAESLDSWFNRYPFFNYSAYKKDNLTYRLQVLDWFKKYGIQYFIELDIWYLDWTLSEKTKYEREKNEKI